MTTIGRILVADDDPMTRRLISSSLESWGYDVQAVADGRSALEAVERDGVQMAILDWMMPHMTGPEVCREIRAGSLALSPYLILLTARGGQEDLVAGLEAGADEYIVKPLDPVELKARISVGERLLELQVKLAARVTELEDALDRVRRLEGLIPICMYCKKVRNGESYWEQVERYLSDRVDVRFSHGICPECMEKVEVELDALESGSSKGEGR